MLFFLTGNIQTGKTRWLERVIDMLEQRSIGVYGVVAPGVWMECGPNGARDTGAGAGGAYEKTGIDNVLLPSRERLSFARRNDDALREGGPDNPGAWDPSERVRRKPALWQFDDVAIARVNAHFDQIARWADGVAPTPRNLVVVDEFGQLELYLDEGLASAVRIIDRGATTAFPHALVVVRQQLLDRALERFADAPWNGIQAIGPDDEARDTLLAAFADM